MIYALAGVQDIAIVELPDGAVARQAVAASGMFARHGMRAEDLRLGLFGKLIAPDQPLREGDRVEILRALAADPNEARRRRARPARRR